MSASAGCGHDPVVLYAPGVFDPDQIRVYGNYAIKLLRLQNDMIQTFDRYQRGNKQTVEVRHVHIHPGGQGVVGIINPPGDREGGGQE